MAKRPVTQKDLDVVGAKLSEVGMMWVSLHQIATSEVAESGALQTVAEQFAKRSCRLLDACLVKLDQGPPMGFLEDEFEDPKPIIVRTPSRMEE